jgi:hypothetical protein
VGDKAALAGCLEGLAGVAATAGGAARAARLLGAADALRQAIGAPLPVAYQTDVDRYLARARAALDPAAFSAAWTAGRALRPDDAITEALAPLP